MMKSKSARHSKTVDNGLALKFKRAAEYVDGCGGGRGRMDIEGKCSNRRYRFINQDRLNLYDGFVGDWKPLTREDNRGEKLNKVSFGSSDDGYIRIGDLILAWQPEEQAKLRDDVVLYHNHVAATQIQFSGGTGIDVDSDVTELSNKNVKTSVDSNIQAAETAVQRQEAKLSDMAKEKLAAQSAIRELNEKFDGLVNRQPIVAVPAQLARKGGRPPKQKDAAVEAKSTE